MNSVVCTVGGVGDIGVTRCGYTGEDGFELSIPNEKAEELSRLLLSTSPVQPTGLGARDSLRLEAGLCLYGNDMTADTNPVQAGLAWTIAKARRQREDFPGAEVIMDEMKNKPKTRRVGLVSQGPPVRPPSQILDQEGNPLGTVCSGCPSPSLGKNVFMAYLPTAHAKAGTPLQVSIRGKSIPATVTKMPFVPTNYFSLPA